MIAFIVENSAVILACLLAISEVLALVPGLKSNSVFQLIVNLVKQVAGSKPAPAVEAPKQ